MQMAKQDATPRIVRRGWIDVTDQVVTLGSGERAHRYTSAGLAAPVREYLCVLGLKTALLADRDADAAYALLRDGRLPALKSPAPPRRSKWREAIAVTLAHAAAVAAAPKGTKRGVLEQMSAERLPFMQQHVAALPKGIIQQLSAREDVSETYRRMFNGKDDGQLSLLAMAGVDGPLPVPEQPEPITEMGEA